MDEKEIPDIFVIPSEEETYDEKQLDLEPCPESLCNQIIGNGKAKEKEKTKTTTIKPKGDYPDYVDYGDDYDDVCKVRDSVPEKLIKIQEENKKIRMMIEKNQLKSDQEIRELVNQFKDNVIMFRKLGGYLAATNL